LLLSLSIPSIFSSPLPPGKPAELGKPTSLNEDQGCFCGYSSGKSGWFTGSEFVVKLKGKK